MKNEILAKVVNNPHVVASLSQEDANDKGFIKSLIQKNWKCFEFCNDKMKGDYEIAELAIKYGNLRNMDFVKNKDVLVEYAGRNPEFIQSAKYELKNDKNIALIVVKSNPATIEYVSSNMKNDIDVVSAAVAKGGADLIKFANFSGPRSIYSIFDQNLELINYVPQEIISGDQNLINIQEISQLMGLMDLY